VKRSGRARVIASLPWLALLLGVIGLTALRARAPATLASGAAAGEFWDASTAEGSTRRPSGGKGLLLPSGTSLHLHDEDGALERVESVTVGVVPTSGGLLEVTLREDAGRSYVLSVTPGSPLALVVTYRVEGATPVIVKRAQVPSGGIAAPFELRVGLERSAFTAQVDGQPALSWRDERLTDGKLSIGARLRPCTLTSLKVTGTRTSQVGKTEAFERSEDFAAASRALWPTLAGSLGLAAAAFALLCIYLRILVPGAALVRDHPAGAEGAGAAGGQTPSSPRSGASVLQAAAVAATPLALLLALSLVRSPPVPEAWLPLGTFLLAAGALLGLLMLRPRIAAGARAPLAGRLVGWLAAAALIAVTARAVFLRHDLVTGPLLAEERAAVAAERAEPAPPADHAEALRLDAANALTFAGPWRDLDLHADVTLAPDSLLEVRLRATTPPSCRGVALWLPSDARLRSGFVIEENRECAPIGDDAGPVAAGSPMPLDIRVRGRRFEATAGGTRLAAEDLRFPAGSIAILAARGSAEVRGVTVQTVAASEPPGRPVRGWLGAALAPIGLVLAFAGLAAALLRLPPGFTVAACAFALLPIAIALWPPAPDPAITRDTLAKVSLGVVVLLLLPCFLHGARASPLRPLLVALLACVGAPAAVALAAPSVLKSGWLSWSGERLDDDLAWLQHPELRSLNGYLADHRFRGRELALAKPAGTARVITLGASSTWGFGLPDGTGQEYPMVLERLLNDGDDGTDGQHGAAPARRVEVINAACLGATGEQQYRLLRDALLAFEPDVVTVSLYYNDSFALTASDESATVGHFCAPGYSRSLLDDLLLGRQLQKGLREVNELLNDYHAWPGSTTQLWRRMGHAEDPPAPQQRFEAMLRRFALLGRERGFRLVLIKEPVRDRHTIWREECQAAVDTLAAEFGLEVVDPWPALEAAGAGPLFMDVVHPRPEGLRIIAEELLPAVRKALGP
jgi:lysophospholipase L1-like esterase